MDRPPPASRWPLGRLLRWWPGLLLAGLCLPAVVAAQPATAREFDVKAALLIKFTQYVAWPEGHFPSATTPVVIGVCDGDQMVEQLRQGALGLMGARPVEVRRVATLAEAARCHVLYLSEAHGREEAEWFPALRGRPILTVGESALSLEQGAVLRFLLLGKNVRFEASLAAARENGLSLREGLLRAAVKVHRAPRQG